MLMEIVRSAHH